MESISTVEGENHLEMSPLISILVWVTVEVGIVAVAALFLILWSDPIL
jgi:hypothetical protein